MRLADLFTKAIEVLKRDGWRTGTYGLDNNGPCCVAGALLRATHELGHHRVGISDIDREYSVVYKTLMPIIDPDDRYGFIHHWNDVQITDAPIVEALEKAALAASDREWDPRAVS